MNFCQVLRGVAVAMSAFFTISSGHGQTAEHLLRGVINATRQNQQPAVPFPAEPPPSQAQATVAPPAQPLWPNRQAFLDAAQSGRLLSFEGISQDERHRFAGSLYAVLVSDYGIPLIPRDCMHMFPSQSVDLIAAINRGYGEGVNDRPPEFTGRNFDPNRVSRSVDSFKQPFRSRPACTTGGQMHPYQAAMLQLADDYERVTAAYVETERNRWRTEYQAAQTRAQAAEQARQSAARAAEQQKIDAEAARIRADEQRRAQKERARVGG